MAESAGTKKWRAMSIRITPRVTDYTNTDAPRPHVLEMIRVNEEYVRAGAGKDRTRPLCEGGMINGKPCRYPARPGRNSCGRRHHD